MFVTLQSAAGQRWDSHRWGRKLRWWGESRWTNVDDMRGIKKTEREIESFLSMSPSNPTLHHFHSLSWCLSTITVLRPSPLLLSYHKPFNIPLFPLTVRYVHLFFSQEHHCHFYECSRHCREECESRKGLTVRFSVNCPCKDCCHNRLSYSSNTGLQQELIWVQFSKLAQFFPVV